MRTPAPFAVALLLLAAAPCPAQDQVLNLYSARHYDTDEALYANFTRSTGIKINRIEAGDDALIERIRNEGANSPADVLLIVDAARLWNAEQLGLFAKLESKALESRIPPAYRSPDGTWFGFSSRARVLVYNKEDVSAGEVQTYQDLAAPRNRGRVCTRPGSHPYMLSLVSAVIAHEGEKAAEEWARGVVANFARPPRGGDTDQIRAVASGECGVAVSNTYYLVRLMRSKKAEDRAAMEKIGIVWPNQATWGTHVNVSGAGMTKTAPNRDAAVKFLTYLASDEAQAYFANGNNEWPVVKGVKVANPELDALGPFKPDALGVAQLGKYQSAAQRIVDRVGWK
jgi:iron(III) transport system substrate-binding protein